jgi:hypothetical protein
MCVMTNWESSFTTALGTMFIDYPISLVCPLHIYHTLIYERGDVNTSNNREKISMKERTERSIENTLDGR